ncbi:MAG TPA: HTTM domain-containing protein [Polyangiaceae bacterium]|nr:HTTM domain-containing protein [Polyangiaceae bacterium]
MIERWVRFWDRREAPYSLALVRILLGGVLLADLLQAGYFGTVTLLWAPPPLGAASDGTPALVVRLLGASAETAWLLWACAVLCSVLFVLGAAYRVASVALVFVMVELGACQPVGDGMDSILRVVLPVLAVSGANAAWSVDAWFRRRKGAPPRTVTAWPRYLLFLQVIWIYVSAGHQRGYTWGPRGGFSAIGDVLGDPHWARFMPGSLAPLYPLLCLATLVTIVFEVSSPLILLWTWLERHPERGGRFGRFARRFRLRWVWLGAGASLHAGIALCMKLGIFPYGMLALYPVFVHPDELLDAFDRSARFVSRMHRREPNAGSLQPRTARPSQG